MTFADRLCLSLIIALLAVFAIREGDYLSRAWAQRPDIVVSVMGAVRRPGVIQLPAGGRLAHAIERCGGFTTQADQEGVELARELHDGDHFVVGTKRVVAVVTDSSSSPKPLPQLSTSKEEQPPAVVGAKPEPPEKKSRDGLAKPDRRRNSRPDPPVYPLDVNLANAQDFESLPGIGPVLANRIVEARQASPGGTFGSLEELGAIRGIKAKTFSRLKPYLKIEGS